MSSSARLTPEQKRYIFRGQWFRLLERTKPKAQPIPLLSWTARKDHTCKTIYELVLSITGKRKSLSSKHIAGIYRIIHCRRCGHIYHPYLAALFPEWYIRLGGNLKLVAVKRPKTLIRDLANVKELLVEGVKPDTQLSLMIQVLAGIVPCSIEHPQFDRFIRHAQFDGLEPNWDTYLKLRSIYDKRLNFGYRKYEFVVMFLGYAGRLAGVPLEESEPYVIEIVLDRYLGFKNYLFSGHPDEENITMFYNEDNYRERMVELFEEAVETEFAACGATAVEVSTYDCLYHDCIMVFDDTTGLLESFHREEIAANKEFDHDDSIVSQITNDRRRLTNVVGKIKVRQVLTAVEVRRHIINATVDIFLRHYRPYELTFNCDADDLSAIGLTRKRIESLEI